MVSPNFPRPLGEVILHSSALEGCPFKRGPCHWPRGRLQVHFNPATGHHSTTICTGQGHSSYLTFKALVWEQTLQLCLQGLHRLPQRQPMPPPGWICWRSRLQHRPQAAESAQTFLLGSRPACKRCAQLEDLLHQVTDLQYSLQARLCCESPRLDT